MDLEVDDAPDSARSFSEAEERVLTQRLLAIELDIRRGVYQQHRLDLSLVDAHITRRDSKPLLSFYVSLYVDLLSGA